MAKLREETNAERVRRLTNVAIKAGEGAEGQAAVRAEVTREREASKRGGGIKVTQSGETVLVSDAKQSGFEVVARPEAVEAERQRQISINERLNRGEVLKPSDILARGGSNIARGSAAAQQAQMSARNLALAQQRQAEARQAAQTFATDRRSASYEVRREQPLASIGQPQESAILPQNRGIFGAISRAVPQAQYRPNEPTAIRLTKETGVKASTFVDPISFTESVAVGTASPFVSAFKSGFSGSAIGETIQQASRVRTGILQEDYEKARRASRRSLETLRQTQTATPSDLITTGVSVALPFASLPTRTVAGIGFGSYMTAQGTQELLLAKTPEERGRGAATITFAGLAFGGTAVDAKTSTLRFGRPRVQPEVFFELSNGRTARPVRTQNVIEIRTFGDEVAVDLASLSRARATRFVEQPVSYSNLFGKQRGRFITQQTVELPDLSVRASGQFKPESLVQELDFSGQSKVKVRQESIFVPESQLEKGFRSDILTPKGFKGKEIQGVVSDLFAKNKPVTAYPFKSRQVFAADLQPLSIVSRDSGRAFLTGRITSTSDILAISGTSRVRTGRRIVTEQFGSQTTIKRGTPDVDIRDFTVGGLVPTRTQTFVTRPSKAFTSLDFADAGELISKETRVLTRDFPEKRTISNVLVTQAGQIRTGQRITRAPVLDLNEFETFTVRETARPRQTMTQIGVPRRYKPYAAPRENIPENFFDVQAGDLVTIMERPRPQRAPALSNLESFTGRITKSQFFAETVKTALPEPPTLRGFGRGRSIRPANIAILRPQTRIGQQPSMRIYARDDLRQRERPITDVFNRQRPAEIPQFKPSQSQRQAQTFRQTQISRTRAQSALITPPLVPRIPSLKLPQISLPKPSVKFKLPVKRKLQTNQIKIKVPRAFRYTPSAYAAGLGVRGKKKRTLNISGLGVRPI